jgi:Predicted membrane protein (DUF2207)
MTVPEDRRNAIAPPNSPPGVLGTVVFGRAGYEQVTATLLDLAARGHLRIYRVSPDLGGDDGFTWWELESADGSDGVRGYERVLLDELGVQSGPERFPNLTNRSVGKIAVALVGEAAQQSLFVCDPAQRRRTALFWCGVGALVSLVIAGVLAAIVPLLLATRLVSPRRTREGDDLAGRANAFQETLYAHHRDVDSGWFSYAVALGRSAEFAQVLDARDEPTPEWILAEKGTAVTWGSIRDLTLRGSPYGHSAVEMLGPIGPAGV